VQRELPAENKARFVLAFDHINMWFLKTLQLNPAFSHP
jgi:hypothetical protein